MTSIFTFFYRVFQLINIWFMNQILQERKINKNRTFTCKTVIQKKYTYNNVA